MTKLEKFTESGNVLRFTPLRNLAVRYMETGYWGQPLWAGVNDSSFAAMKEKGFDLAGDEDEFCMLTEHIILSNGRQLTLATYKAYFHEREFFGDGLGIYGPARLTTLLKHLSRHCDGQIKSLQLYVDESFRGHRLTIDGGALIVNDDMVIRFSSVFHSAKTKNFFLHTFESDKRARKVEGLSGGISTHAVKVVLRRVPLDKPFRFYERQSPALLKLVKALRRYFAERLDMTV